MGKSDSAPLKKKVKLAKEYTRFKGDDDEHLKTQQLVAKCRLSNGKRIDRQIGSLKPSAILSQSSSHEMKIHRYRDQLMSLLSKQLSNNDFKSFDQRSLEQIGSMAENTETALYSDLLKLVQFCDQHSYCALPLPSYAFDRYLSEMMAGGYKRSTLDRHIASIVRWHSILEMDDPRKSFKVNTRLGKIRQQLKQKSNQKEGLRFEHLVKAMLEFHPAIPRDIADIALLFTAFDTLCRRSELVRFEWDDLLHDVADGSGILKLHSSKTDQYGEGAELYVSPISMKLLNYWKAISSKKGKIFRGIYSNGTMADSLSTKGVERCFKRIATRLELPAHLFAGHSTRVGAAQEMASRDIPMYKIMLSGRWKEVKTLTGYMKRINAKKSGTADLNKLLYENLEQIEETRKLGRM